MAPVILTECNTNAESLGFFKLGNKYLSSIKAIKIGIGSAISNTNNT